MADELHLALLGGLQITRGGVALPGLASHKGQALLCYLALSRRAHSRDTLTDLLWSEASPEEARASLRTVLALLRQVVAPYLTITRTTIAFNPTRPYWLDVEVFQDQLTVAADPAPGGARSSRALQEAVDLYRGEFLEGFYVQQAPVFEEWMLGERQWLRGQAIAGLHRLAAECAQRGEVAAAIDYLNRLLVLEPWREEARREAMQLLAETGQRNAALAQYEVCRRILLAELGVEPAEETRALYQQIVRGEIAARPTVSGVEPPAVVPPVAHNLPAALTPFIGRDVEITQLTERLQRPSVRLLTLVGPGGIGKTRLALDLAARLLPHFPAGVFFVSLAAIRQADLVPSAIAQALLPETGERTALAALTAWLPGRPGLLVLDNFEQLLAATPTVIELLQAAADLTILVTSREPLHVIGEHQFRLLPLPVPTAQRLPALALDSLAQYPAVALFCARAEAVQFGFALTAENATRVVEVCQRLDGSPLAIELAAARVAELGVAEIARRLDDRFRLLSEGNRGAPARQQTLHASIAWSYDLLAAADRHLLDTLAVFAGGWTLPAAAAVAGDAGFAPAAVGAGVRRLVDKSLVVAAADAERYSMHESIRQYCSDRVEEAGATHTLRTRHLQYFTAWAEAAERHLVGPDQGLWLDQLQGEHDNLRAALSWRPDQPARGHAQSELALRLSGALWRFWSLRGHITEGRQRLEAVLAAGPWLTPTDHPPLLPEQRPLLLAWCKVLMGAGALAHEQGDYAGSRSYLEQHLAGRRALGEAKGLAAALNNLAQTVKAQGDLAQARRLAEESLALKRDLGEPLGIANSLGTLGNIACDRADYPAARALYEESLALAREAGDRQGVVTKLNNLGNVLLETQDYAGAQALYEESLALAQELADQPGMARALGNLGRVAADQGQYRHALTLQKGSLEHFQQAGYVREISENLADLALIGGALGWGVAAVRLLGAAEAVRQATHYWRTPADQARSDRDLIKMRAAIAIAPRDWAAAYSEGLAMTVEQVIDSTLAILVSQGVAA